jgi:cellulose synthase/poly-beta-1,6-N-acetylglucosamine synthase-like glycosyltransferase
MHFYNLEIGLLLYFALSLTWSYALMFSAWRILKNTTNKQRIPFHSPPLVSVLIPAYNEETCIVDSVKNTLRNNYPNLEVCICDDASTDSTRAAIDEAFIHDNRVLMISNETNKGRAGALNSALALASGKYVVATDADTILDPDGLTEMVYNMERDTEIEAVGGTLLIANAVHDNHTHIPRAFVAGIQAVEYLRAFLYGRLGLNKLGGNICVSGAFGLFKKNTIERLDGWNEDSVAEDMDMTTRIRMDGGKVVFIPEPVAWTQVPPDITSIGNQRSRWHRGLCQMYFKGPGRKAMGKYGALGFLALPANFFVEWLAPFFEALGLILITTHLISGDFGWIALPILVGGYLLNVMLSLIAIKFEKDNFNRYNGTYGTGILHAFLEPFWFRPLMIFWRFRGMFEFITGKKGWGGLIKRQSFATLAILMLLVAPVKADTWVEGLMSHEDGEVNERTDTTITANYNPITASMLIRSTADDTDRMFALDYHQRLGRRFGGNIGAHVADKGTMLPNSGYYIAPYFVAGHFVFTPAIHPEFFKDDVDLTLASLNVDYYFGYFRLGARVLRATNDPDVDAVTFSLQRIGLKTNWTIYASSGNEVLDIPLQYGDNRVGGGIIRFKTSDMFSLIFGTNMGYRDDKPYITGVLGVRAEF